MRKSGAPKLHSLGRPPAQVRRDVVQHLMEAAEGALARKNTQEITIREIAAQAGADDAMIHYYFGGKDGLMLSLIRDVMKDAPHKRADAIIQDCTRLGSIKPLISAIAAHFYSRPNLSRMIIVEASSKESHIRSLYADAHYSNQTLKFIRKSIKRLSEAGIYKKDANAEFATTAIIGMMLAPTIILYSPEVTNVADKINDQEWIDYISLTIDLTLKIERDGLTPSE